MRPGMEDQPSDHHRDDQRQYPIRSTNTALLKTAASLAPPELTLRLYDGLKVLPQFDPDDDCDPLPVEVNRLRTELDAADAVLICTPEYAGALPGSFKNLLDWTVGGGTYRKPIAWINASWAPTEAAGAHAELRTVLGYVDADIVEAACVRIPVGRPDIGPDGMVAGADARSRILDALRALSVHAEQAKAQRALSDEMSEPVD